MRCANVLDVVDAMDPVLTRARELAETRRAAETTYRAAVAEEREEIARLLEAEEAGPVAIAAAIGRTREAVRLSYRQWQRENGKAPRAVARERDPQTSEVRDITGAHDRSPDD